MLATLAISPETPLLLPLGLICTLLSCLVVATWRLANFIRDLTEAVGKAWTIRDQERWALTLERENRARNIPLYVPDVERADADTEKTAT